MLYLYDINDIKVFLINYLLYVDLIYLLLFWKRFFVCFLCILLLRLKFIVFVNNYFNRFLFKRVKLNVKKIIFELFKYYIFLLSISVLVMVVS